tara:strand:- start:2369 stop:2794 length:426 start_codon:yes stop_codon:yes gene_type:complete
MNKLKQARTYLLGCGLGIEARHLLTFAEKGQISSWRSDRNGNFTIAYTAHFILTDYCKAPQDVFFKLAQWLKENCPNAPEDALKFHVDILDHDKADISIALEMTDILNLVQGPNGNFLQYGPEADATEIGMADFFPGLKNE